MFHLSLSNLKQRPPLQTPTCHFRTALLLERSPSPLRGHGSAPLRVILSSPKASRLLPTAASRRNEIRPGPATPNFYLGRLLPGDREPNRAFSVYRRRCIYIASPRLMYLYASSVSSIQWRRGYGQMTSTEFEAVVSIFSKWCSMLLIRVPERTFYSFYNKGQLKKMTRNHNNNH